MTDRDTPPQYAVAVVEALMLEVAAELHPQHLSTRDLSRGPLVVGDLTNGRPYQL